MELRFCDECGSRIADDEIAGGRALIRGDFAYCTRCARKKASEDPPPAPTRSEAPGAPAGGRSAPGAASKPVSPGSGSKLPRPTTPGKGQAGSFRPPTPQQGTIKLPAPGRNFQSSHRIPAVKRSGRPFGPPAAPARSPSTAKLPAPRSGSSGIKPPERPARQLERIPLAKADLPASPRGRRREGKDHTLLPEWGGVAIRAFALFAGGLLLGYLGLMLMTRQGLISRFGTNAKQPAPGEAVEIPEAPAAPEVPETSVPPVVPDVPDVPAAPSTPAAPAVPELGREAEPSVEPPPAHQDDTPAPAAGHQPNVPAEPAAPDVPQRAPGEVPVPAPR